MLNSRLQTAACSFFQNTSIVKSRVLKGHSEEGTVYYRHFSQMDYFALTKGWRAKLFTVANLPYHRLNSVDKTKLFCLPQGRVPLDICAWKTVHLCILFKMGSRTALGRYVGLSMWYLSLWLLETGGRASTQTSCVFDRCRWDFWQASRKTR